VLDHAIAVRVAELRPVGTRGRRLNALVHPGVEHVNEAVHHSREIEDLHVPAPPCPERSRGAVGEHFSAAVTDAANFVHPVAG
jgi:hypothetical protein